MCSLLDNHMTYSFDTLFQEYCQSSSVTDYGWQPTINEFIRWCSSHYNDAVDEGIPPDPMWVWVLDNHPAL